MESSLISSERRPSTMTTNSMRPVKTHSSSTFEVVLEEIFAFLVILSLAPSISRCLSRKGFYMFVEREMRKCGAGPALPRFIRALATWWKCETLNLSFQL